MGCFEDYMQFREEVDAAKRRVSTEARALLRRSEAKTAKDQEEAGQPSEGL